MSKYACPPQTGSGQGTFSDNLVGLQLTQGGGLTQSNFIFTNTITEKVNRNFETGKYSNPINLDNLNISSLQQAQQISNVNFKIYPNFDQTVVTNYVAYGSLSKRLSAAVLNIINYFPAALEITSVRPNYSSGFTAQNIFYDSSENMTYFSISTDSIKNPFSIDYTTQATLNLSNLGFEVSKYRNLPAYFNNYIVQVTGSSFTLSDITASTYTTNDTLYFSAFGNLFGDSVTEIYDTIIIRPNDFTVNEVFNLDLDEVEELLLNRYSIPKYTSQYKVLSESEDGNQFFRTRTRYL